MTVVYGVKAVCIIESFHIFIVISISEYIVFIFESFEMQVWTPKYFDAIVQKRPTNISHRIGSCKKNN